jgi:ABC-type spermidine/putrescine transport system permease subunit II
VRRRRCRSGSQLPRVLQQVGPTVRSASRRLVASAVQMVVKVMVVMMMNTVVVAMNLS